MGIGTASPARPLTVSSDGEIKALFENTDTNATQYAYVDIESNASSGGQAVLRLITPDGTSKINSLGSATEMTFSSGNVGIGASPSASHADYTQLHLGGNGVLVSHTAAGASKHSNFAQNAYINASPAWTYISEDEASLYQQTNGGHTFYTAASSTGAVSWTTNMVL